MDARDVGRRARRGGDGIPTLQATPVRLTAGAGAVTLAAALAAYLALAAGQAESAVLALGAIGVIFCTFAVGGMRGALGLTLAVLLAELALVDATSHLPQATPVWCAAVLVAIAEMSSVATTLERTTVVERRVLMHRGSGHLASFGIAAAAAGSALCGAALATGTAVLAVAVGGIGAVVLLLAAKQLARR